MSGPLSWTFEILDRSSGPLKAMNEGLEKFNNRTTGVGRGLDAIGEKLHGSAKAGLHGFTESIGHARERVRDWLEIVYFGGEILKGIGETAMEVGREILEGMRFKQSSLLALEAMTGTREAARGIFESVEGFAARTGMAVTTVMGTTKELMRSGYSPAQTEVLRQMIADLNVVGPEAAGAMTNMLHNIGLMGGIDPAMAKRWLRGAGLDVQEFNRQLKTVNGDQLLALVKTFQARYDTKNRGLGALALDFSKTLPGAVDRLKQLPELVMSALSGFDSGAGGGLFARALSNIADAFSPGSEAGERIIGRAKLLVDRVAEAFGLGGKGGFLEELAGPNGIAKVEQLFDKVASGIEGIIPTVKSAARGLWEIGRALAWIAETIGAVKGTGDSAARLANSGDEWLAQHGMGFLAGNDKVRETARANLPPVPGSSRVAQTTQHVTFSPQVTVHVEGDASHETGEQIATKVQDALQPFAAGMFEQLALQGGTD